MPIYEFKCKKCGEEFEKLCKMGTEFSPCPKCKNEDVEKKMSNFGFKSGSTFKSSSNHSSCGSCSSGNCSSCH